MVSVEYFEVYFPKTWSEYQVIQWLDKRVGGHQFLPDPANRRVLVRLESLAQVIRRQIKN